MRRIKYRLGESEDLAKLIIRGFDGEGDTGATGGSGGAGEGGSEGDSGDGDTGGTDAGGGEDAGDDGDDSDLPDDNAELKNALKAARKEAKLANKAAKVSKREADRLKKAEEDKATAEKGEVEAATKKATEAAEKATKLAGRLRQRELESAITAAARKANFRDPDDVITQLHRSNFAGIEIDQDEDDPSDIEVDAKSVEKAVKKIATEKPHWLVAAGDGKPSGSSFNGGSPGGKPGTKTQEYASRFPALRNRIGNSSQG